jgi:cobalt-zinc-cadmium efflux system membrane fusion protein
MSAPRYDERDAVATHARARSGRRAVRVHAGLRTLSLLVAAAGLALALAGAPQAHEGHDHGDATAASPAPASDAPRRLPDGSLFLPKASQRLVGVRTVVATEGEQSRSVDLPGLVAIEPDAAGRVQSTVPGRIEPGPRGLPSVGQKVARGQVLAIVRPSIDPVARSNQAAALAELEASRTLAAARVERLRGLADTVPRKEIDAAASELASLDGRIRAVSGGLAAAEPLLAPVAGVVARADAVAGQVVDARELLFEIIDPTRLRIEATVADVAIAAQVADASIAVGGRTVPLAFVGAGRVLREQTVPLVFRARGPAIASLSVGQPVAVTVRLSGTARGVALPASALARNASNEPVVWVKTAPERFEPRRVRVEPLDASRVRVVDGLAGGERVVTDGAPLLGQFR